MHLNKLTIILVAWGALSFLHLNAKDEFFSERVIPTTEGDIALSYELYEPMIKVGGGTIERKPTHLMSWYETKLILEPFKDIELIKSVLTKGNLKSLEPFEETFKKSRKMIDNQPVLYGFAAYAVLLNKEDLGWLALGYKVDTEQIDEKTRIVGHVLTPYVVENGRCLSPTFEEIEYLDNFKLNDPNYIKEIYNTTVPLVRDPKTKKFIVPPQEG